MITYAGNLSIQNIAALLNAVLFEVNSACVNVTPVNEPNIPDLEGSLSPTSKQVEHVSPLPYIEQTVINPHNLHYMISTHLHD